MREDYDRRARGFALEVGFDPFQLVRAEIAAAAGLQIKHVDEGDEMNAAVIEAVPAIGGFASAETLEKCFAVVADRVVLAGNVEGLESRGFYDLRRGVELGRLGEMRHVARVDQKRWLILH